MNVAAFTKEKIALLQEEAQRVKNEHAEVEGRDAAAMWLLDLQAIQTAYSDYKRRLAQRRADEGEPRASAQASSQRAVVKRRRGPSVASEAKKPRTTHER